MEKLLYLAFEIHAFTFPAVASNSIITLHLILYLNKFYDNRIRRLDGRAGKVESGSEMSICEVSPFRMAIEIDGLVRVGRGEGGRGLAGGRRRRLGVSG